MTRPAQPVAVAVVEQEDQFLVGPRPAGVALGGLWEFPGGKIKPNESAADAARRECLEETGIAVEVTGHLGTVTYQYEYGLLELQFLACRPASDDRKPRPPYRWVPRAQLSQYAFPPANAQLLARLLANG